MSGMFYSCSDLTSLDLSGFDMSKVTRYSAIDMLNKCSALKELTISENCTNGIWNMMHLSNGQNDNGWCVKGSTTKVSGNGAYAIIAAPNKTTTYALLG